MSAKRLRRFRDWAQAALLMPVALLAVGCGDGPNSELIAQLRPKLLLEQEPDQVVQISELREQFAPGDELSASLLASEGESQLSETDASAHGDESADGSGTRVSQPREVALLGVVGGVTNPYNESRPEFPFARGEALFYLADVGIVAEAEAEGHQHAPGEDCAFCAAHAEDDSIGCRRLNKHPTRLSTIQRTQRNRYFVTRLQCRAFPAASCQIVWAHPFQTPGDDVAFVIADIDPDPDVRVGPLNFVHCPRNADLGLHIEH